MRCLVATLLFLFPPEFRRRFGADMLALFEERWQEQPGWGPAFRILFDLAFAAARERFSRRRQAVKHSHGKGDTLMTVLIQDLRFAWRTLARSRGFAIVTLLILALGIGLNTAMFSIAHAVLWRSLPYPQPDRLVLVGEVDAHDPKNYWGAAYPNLQDWRRRATSFEKLAGVMGIDHILREGSSPVRVNGAAVSADFFQVMGVKPIAGRVFGEREGRNGLPHVIVLSHHMWMERLGGDPAVVGRSIRLGTNSYSVMGVMPAGFEYREAEFWTSLEQEIDPVLTAHRNIWVLDPVGRLRAGVSAEAAAKEVETLQAEIRKEYPETRRGQVVRAVPLGTELSHDLRPALLLLLGAASTVLLIVCANIAALMLVRGTARQKEMAIRRALGVNGMRLVRQFLTESALLACAGGALGIGLAFLATRLLDLLTHDPRLLHVPIDGAVLTFAAAATVATTVLFGIFPASRAAKVDAAEALKSGSRAGMSRGGALAQRTLVVMEVALCLVLLAGAGLLMKSFRRVLEVNPGFRVGNLLTLRVALPPNYDSDQAVNAFYRRLDIGLSTLPGLRGVTLASQLPISGGEGNADIAIEGRPSAEGELGASTFRRVTPTYFGVMGIPVLRGRPFEERDNGSPTRPAIINQGFATRFWPNTDPIGRRFKIGARDRAQWLTIVGVVGDVHQIGLDSSAPFSTYEPLASNPHTRFDVAVRSPADPGTVLSAIRGELRKLDPALLIEKAQTMSERIDDTVAPRRLNLVLFELLAGLSLLLAAIGLYGVVAFAAGQRSHEFGIRMALGAQGRDVLRLVIAQGVKLALIGTAFGIAVTLYITRLMTGLLFNVQPTDLATLAGVAALLVVVAVAACWLPAYRATRIAPLESFRVD